MCAVVAKSLRPVLIYDLFCWVIILHQILFQLHHLYSGAKSNVISLYSVDINLKLASGDYFSVLYICLKWVKSALFRKFGELKLLFFTRKATQNVALISSLDVIKLHYIGHL